MSNFYWYDGEKIPLTPSTVHRAVRLPEGATKATRQFAAQTVGAASQQSTGLDLGGGVYLFEGGPAPAPSFSAQTAALPGDGAALPVFSADDDVPMVVTEEFIAQFEPELTREQIDAFNAEHGVKVVSEQAFERNGFVLTVPPGEDAVEMANTYHESGRTVYAQPNFVRVMKPAFTPNDPMFPAQWALNNTGQLGGVAGHDIEATLAWDVHRGSAAITIAIIDEGVDYTHPDLNVAGKLVTGYDAVRRINDPGPENDDAHGTACAGIAAAAAGNGTGVSGVAPNCRVMGVRIARGVNGGWATSDAIIADGINTAVARGADVLSNSWGGGSPSAAITAAIRNARTRGRGGRGCIVVFAAGNNDGPVSYPGTLPEVITVAACNEFGERKSKTSRDRETWWGSNFGPEVDVCAPGVHITTTDINGTRGYSQTGYTSTFNGTSAATPHVAGVAALCLSVSPALLGTEVEAILRQSTDDLGAQGYDVFTGSGRINAHKAVRAAFTRWEAPRQIPGWFGAEDQEGDIALMDITGNGRTDLLVFHIDNPGGENHGYYRIGYDLDTSGVAQSWSPIRAVPGWFGAEDQGAGVALADINRNGRPDLLVFHVDNPGGENHGYYRIGWNLDATGVPTGGWSPVLPVPGWFGAEDQGAGVALGDISRNGRQDLVVFHIDNPGRDNHGYYRIGWDLDGAGVPRGGWSPVKAIPGWFGWENQGGGIALADLNGDGRPELIVYHIDNPGGDNRGYYRVGWNLNQAGDVTGGWSDPKPIPGWFGWENQGGGIAAADIDRNGRTDLVAFHIDNPGGENHGYYRVGFNVGA